MNWIAERKKEAREMQEYASQLEKRNEELVHELSRISTGITLADQPVGWSQDFKLQDRASRIIKKHATAPLMRRPYSSW